MHIARLQTIMEIVVQSTKRRGKDLLAGDDLPYNSATAHLLLCNQTYHTGIDKGIFEVLVASKQLFSEKRCILHVFEEGDEDRQLGRDMRELYLFHHRDAGS